MYKYKREKKIEDLLHATISCDENLCAKFNSNQMQVQQKVMRLPSSVRQAVSDELKDLQGRASLNELMHPHGSTPYL